MVAEAVKQEIQQAYRQFLSEKGLKPRYGQRLMVAELARTLFGIQMDEAGKRVGESHICVVEAGTGTGKTLAYLLGVLPIAKVLEKKVVLATATIALQDQVINKDIPDLLANTDLSFSYSLAKGRGRYLCLSKLDRMLKPGQDVGGTLALWEDYQQYALDKDELVLFNAFSSAIDAGSWTGDRDRWPDAVKDHVWYRVTNDHRGCTGRGCRFYEDCPFFLARSAVYKTDLVVANHDLVLADLAMGGGVVLPPPEETIYIFDEGHHLPDKALGHFACSTQLRTSQQWLVELAKMLESLIQVAGEGGLPNAIQGPVKQLSETISQQLHELLISLEPLMDQTEQDSGQQGARLVYRFEQGQVPQAIRQQAEALAEPSRDLARQLQVLVDWLQEGMDGKRSDITKADAEAWSPLLSTQSARAEAMLTLWQRFEQEDSPGQAPFARWLTFTASQQGVDIELSACPVLAGDVLGRYLWSRAFAVMVTSATLAALGTFERFQFRAGTPVGTRCVTVPSPFNYETHGKIRVPKEACDPTDSQHHDRALVAFLSAESDSVPGTLVLFSSRRQMEEVYELLPASIQERVLAQGAYSKMAIIERHRRAVDAGSSSLIFGLASFAEGVDLPGDYCRRVVIARLPFSVPEDPVEATLADWIRLRQGNPFMQITVPDASIRLKQAAGRLLRNEDDWGEICILDRRIISKRYGKLLLSGLPPFPLEVE